MVCTNGDKRIKIAIYRDFEEIYIVLITGFTNFEILILGWASLLLKLFQKRSKGASCEGLYEKCPKSLKVNV